MSETIIKFDNVKKEYRLGQIGGSTLRGDLQSWAARIRGKEDPNSLIGSNPVEVGKRFLALDGISFEVKKGEALGIIGHNGAGKSTLLKLLSRVTAPSSGTISYNGRIASMLEVGTGFHPEMTGRENIYMNGAILGMTKAEIDAKMEDIIEFSEVRQFIDTPVKRYSSGMYVKLAFSVAAHLDSEIMIMDEVLAVGDMAFQKKCLDKMKQAANEDGRTVLYVSHNMSTIRQLCGRCIVLDKGKVIFDGAVEDAIAIYSNVSGAKQKHYEYSKQDHSPFNKPNGILLNSLFALNSDDNSYECGDIAAFKLSFFSETDRKNLRFRFEIKSKDSTPVGTMFSKDQFFCQKGDNTVTIEMDTAHLVPGRYLIDIVAFICNDIGTEQFLDGVYPGIIIDINERISENNSLIWLGNSWGNIHLHDLGIK